ncbi:N-acetylornithine carbamoyltransferase [Reichenbachiella agariperforans]|uniref:N-acetylornithine carbamoyltransferase n=1 Tax=Reichenbachiella agariperforans TaxID=156994 RepID=UPI001C0A0545|nr:N-acetylornithine carbamoyltransferase [Reichenbachiella agariperforans]MBU2916201.1 N-acetylornithine carbamoyltransferase [Reichenbachiella agariperforans]
MTNFCSIDDVDDPVGWIQSAVELKKKIEQDGPFTKNGKSVCLLFFNPSLRTRLSMQKASFNLGIESFIFNLNTEGWQLEFGDGVVMNGNTSEHIIEAAGVMSSYFDAIGIRAFASLSNKQEDYQEKILSQFVKHCSVPVINMESATSHPLQSFADMITIEEYKKVDQPRVVLSWAPHPKALPQAVANSFLNWSNRMDYDLVLTHPKGYELDPGIVGNATVEYDQNKAFDGADFIYTKNWSAFNDESYGQVVSQDPTWTITPEKMALTNAAKFMHCLPIRRNVIATDGVLDHESSIVIAQANHRITSAQAVLQKLLNVK